MKLRSKDLPETNVLKNNDFSGKHLMRFFLIIDNRRVKEKTTKPTTSTK